MTAPTCCKISWPCELNMQLIPSIDLLDAGCVRLMHGNFNEVTRYPEEPLDIARRYHDDGAEWLHVVDLAASRDGNAADSEPLFKLLETAPQRVQTGGGVRAGGDVQARLDHGAERVVVGSLCVTETERVINWIRGFGADHIVAALDVRVDKDGTPRPRIYGWTEGTDTNLWKLLKALEAGGLRHVLITDIGRDGAMHGPNLRLYREVAERHPGLRLQASGGVGAIEDLESLRHTGADSVIVGKALLERTFTAAAALEALQ